jgi:hypothetical protein
MPVSADFVLRLIVIEKKNAARYLLEQELASRDEDQDEREPDPEGETDDSVGATDYGGEADPLKSSTTVDELGEETDEEETPSEHSSLLRRQGSRSSRSSRSLPKSPEIEPTKPILSAMLQLITTPEIVVCLCLIVISGFITGL